MGESEASTTVRGLPRARVVCLALSRAPENAARGRFVFTGLVEELGHVDAVVACGDDAVRLRVRAQTVVADAAVGSAPTTSHEEPAGPRRAWGS